MAFSASSSTSRLRLGLSIVCLLAPQPHPFLLVASLSLFRSLPLTHSALFSYSHHRLTLALSLSLCVSSLTHMQTQRERGTVTPSPDLIHGAPIVVHRASLEYPILLLSLPPYPLYLSHTHTHRDRLTRPDARGAGGGRCGAQSLAWASHSSPWSACFSQRCSSWPSSRRFSCRPPTSFSSSTKPRAEYSRPLWPQSPAGSS